tara:strand:+ start:49 stop:936 length:888 start_codon:yes stop_codon:yes gene_type:complete
MKIKNNYFKNKNIIITGGNQGLGLELVKHFYSLGANIIVCARNQKKLNNIKNNLKIRKSQKIMIEKCDISRSNHVDKLFSKIFKKFKKIDILINNAGIYGPKGSVETLLWNEIKKTFETNLFASIYLIKKIIPHFKKNNKGKIIQISGGGAAGPLPYFSAYASSKAAIVRFVENVSKELESHKIYINAVAPGPINTRMLDEVLSENPETVGRSFYKKSINQKKTGGTDMNKILKCIEFFCHKKSDGISGKLISVLWDDWHKFTNYKKILNKSDLGTIRRIAGRDRNINFFDKNEK